MTIEIKKGAPVEARPDEHPSRGGWRGYTDPRGGMSPQRFIDEMHADRNLPIGRLLDYAFWIS